ncbi:hypothetical protein [Streptomyces sp. NPDC006477]|uniref:hypothetical protein n=1 Tax=Streptomyces sp. NPDC006477 TaxID=3364747 RepID=UPI0036C75333
MTDTLTSRITAETERLGQIDDLVDRFRGVRDFREKLAAGERTALAMQKAIVLELKTPDRPWRVVGEMLGVSGSRAQQIAAGKKS